MGQPDGSYPWEEESRMEAEPCPAGTWDLTVDRVIYGKTVNGQLVPFESNNGDRQIWAFFRNPAGQECSEMLTLSAKAAWKLRDILRSAGANMATYTAKNVQPIHFGDEKFCSKQLVGRKFRAKVEYNEKNYAEVSPLRPPPPGTAAAPVTPAAAPKNAPPEMDDPFA